MSVLSALCQSYVAVEGYSAEVCQNFVRYEVRPKKIKDRDRFGFPFGQYTDDSTAYSVAETLTDRTTSKLFQTRDSHLCSFK
jgi:hypothetical protein